MQEEVKKNLIRFFAIGLLVLVSILVYHRFSFYREGPSIIGINLTAYEEQVEASKEIHISTKNTHSIRINGNPLQMNEGLEAHSIIALHPGENEITIELSDNFNKKRYYTYHIYRPVAGDNPITNLTQARAQKNKEEAEKETY